MFLFALGLSSLFPCSAPLSLYLNVSKGSAEWLPSSWARPWARQDSRHRWPRLGQQSPRRSTSTQGHGSHPRGEETYSLPLARVVSQGLWWGLFWLPIQGGQTGRDTGMLPKALLMETKNRTCDHNAYIFQKNFSKTDSNFISSKYIGQFDFR